MSILHSMEEPQKNVHCCRACHAIISSESLYCATCLKKFESKGLHLCKKCLLNLTANEGVCAACESKMCKRCGKEIDKPGFCERCDKIRARIKVIKYVSCILAVILLYFPVTKYLDSRAAIEEAEREQRMSEYNAEKENQRMERARERREANAFEASREAFKIYETYGGVWLQRIPGPAKDALKKYANNPSSVQDVVAISPVARVRMKAYPSCRFMATVSFRATNVFGALTKQQAIVLLDSDLNGVAVLNDMP